MKAIKLLVLAPMFALAQTSIPTTFPQDSVSLSSEELRQRISGKVFTVKPAVGDSYRLQYNETFVYLNSGPNSDSGKWRIEGSSICVDWLKITKGCSEARTLGEVLYVKRVSNGEVIVMHPK